MLWSVPCQTCSKRCISSSVLCTPLHPWLIDSLLDDVPYRVVDRVQDRTVRWPQIQWNESRHCLLEKSYSVRFAKIWTSNFCKVVQQHTEGMMGSIIWFCCKFSYLSSSEKIWKISYVKNWQSYRHEFVCTTFFETQCIMYKVSYSICISVIWLGTNLIHDFTAVTFFVKFAFFREKRPFPWNSVTFSIFREF